MDVPVVVLCGGRGLRLGEHTASIPKPLVEIGGEPILWHILKGYAAEGFKKFVLCLGYRGEKIHAWVDRLDRGCDWNVTCVNTGLETGTGGRLLQVEGFVEGRDFFMTYGDGLSDVSPRALLQAHREHGRVATVTSVRPRTPFGILDVEEGSVVTAYREKPRLEAAVNGGFFGFRRDVFRYIRENEMLEAEPMQRLIAERQLVARMHDGFWAPMDTAKDWQELNDLWASGRAPWRTW